MLKQSATIAAALLTSCATSIAFLALAKALILSTL